MKSIGLIAVIGMFSVLLVSNTIQPALFHFIITNRTKKKRVPLTLLSLIRSIFAFVYFGVGCFIMMTIGFIIMKLFPLKLAVRKNWFHHVRHWSAKSMIYVNRHVSKQILNVENEQLIIAFSELLTQSLSVFYKVQQDQQLLILKERNTIARELHDSIAQSLSCLKIKLSILQMDLSNLDEDQISIIGEMREEVNVAYCQLRELLTTFRLRLDGLGFLPALENTVKEYNKKIGTKINFSYEIPANKISTHHSIHLIQIN